MAAPTITRNLAFAPDANDPYNERGAWATATSYDASDMVARGNGVYVCVSAHTSGSTTEPGVGASWATVWELYHSIPATDVVDVIDPGASWAPTLANGEVYYLEGSNPTQVAPANSAGSGESLFVLLYVKGGSGLSWSGVTLSSNVSLSSDSSVVDLVALYDVSLNGSAQGWRAIQLDTTAAAATLPSSITNEYPLLSDFVDAIGADDFTAVNSPTFVGSGDYGASFTEASTQYATLGSLLVDPNGDFTLFLALPDLSTAPANLETFFCIGDGTGNDYVVIWQNAVGNLIAHLDDAGSLTADLTIGNANLPASHALYMLRRSGTTWRFECLTNGAADTTTYSSTLAVDRCSIGARVKAGSYDQHRNGTILWLAVADGTAITSTDDLTAVRSFVQTDRGLASA